MIPMNHRELNAKYASYDVKDCKEARKSLAYYKKRSHRLIRNSEKGEIKEAMEDRGE
jgi:hypothetical protein